MPPEEDAVAKDARSLLLETLVAQAGGGGGVNVQELLLSQLGDTDDDADPTVGLIARYLAQSQTEQAEGDTSPDEEDMEFFDSPSELDKVRSEERARSFQRLRQTMEQMYEELEALRERNDALAAALGACHLCWGKDFDCPVCGGTGHPGFSMPDRSLLVQLVTPAVQRLREREGLDQRPSGGPDSQT
jgi:hypothetical protein